MVNTSHQFLQGMSSEEINRQEMLAQMLLQQSQQPIQAPRNKGNLESAVSPLEVLSKLTSAYFGGTGLRKAGQDKSKYESLLAEDYAKGLEAYQQRAKGGEAVDLQGQLGPDGQAPMKRVPGDRQAAIMEAMASQNPRLRQFAQSELERLSKLSEVGGVLYDPMSMQVQQLEGGQPGLQQINGDLYQTNPTTGQLKKLDNAPKMSVSVGGPQVIMGKGQTKLAETLASEAVKDVQESAKAAGDATKMLDSVNRMREAGDTFSGTLAPAAVWFGQLGESLGVGFDKAKLANTETFNSEATQMLLSVVNSVGGARGLTETEQKAIARSLPNLVQTKEGRDQVLEMLEGTALRAREIAEAKQNALIKAGQADDPTVYFEALKEAGLPQYSPQKSSQSSQSSKIRKYNPETGRIE